jgi:hypothetical protein
VPRKLWSNPHNPPASVAHALGISRPQLGAALHKIKRDAGLRPPDRVTIWDNGDITDDAGIWIGNVYD